MHIGYSLTWQHPSPIPSHSEEPLDNGVRSFFKLFLSKLSSFIFKIKSTITFFFFLFPFTLFSLSCTHRAENANNLLLILSFCPNVWIFKLEDLTHQLWLFHIGDCRNIWAGYQHHKEASWRRARQNNPRERHTCMWLFLCLELLERNINYALTLSKK